MANASTEQLVENVIREIKPQVVMVELDAQRVGSFLEEAKPKVRAAKCHVTPPAVFFHPSFDALGFTKMPRHDEAERCGKSDLDFIFSSDLPFFYLLIAIPFTERSE